MGTVGTGIFLVILGAGSMSFHNAGSEIDGPGHLLDRIAMFALFGWLTAYTPYSLYSTWVNNVVTPRDTGVSCAQVLAMICILAVIFYESSLTSTTGLLYPGALIFTGNLATMAVLFWQADSRNTTQSKIHKRKRWKTAFARSLPTFCIRFLHLGLAFVLQGKAQSYFEKSLEIETETNFTNMYNSTIKKIWEAGVREILNAGNENETQHQLLGYQNQTQATYMDDSEYVRRLYRAADVVPPKFTYSFDERVEFRKRFDLCHGAWHFHTAVVLMGLGTCPCRKTHLLVAKRAQYSFYLYVKRHILRYTIRLACFPRL